MRHTTAEQSTVFIPIEITVDVRTSVFGDIAITAIEGGHYGIGHWAQADAYDWQRWAKIGDTSTDGDSRDVDEDFVFYRIAPINDNEDGYDWDKAQDVTPRFIARGLALFLRSNTLDDPNEFDMMDANEADLVFQYAFFGEETYS